jgi:hypothetical protein
MATSNKWCVVELVEVLLVPRYPMSINLLTTTSQAEAELKGIREAGGDAELFQ